MPSPRTETIRDALRAALADGEPRTLQDLSVLVGVSERDLPHHLDHLEKSVRREGGLLGVEPARCVACGFVFEKARFKKPGRCPHCKATRISPPRVRLV